MPNQNQILVAKVTRLYNEDKRTTSDISHQQFKTSTEDERCPGDRRTDKQHAMFGHYHTSAAVIAPYGPKLVRVFFRPSIVKDTEERHNTNEADMAARFKQRKDNTVVRILWTLASDGYFDYRTVHNISQNEEEDYINFYSAQVYSIVRALEDNTSAIS
ncbi:hypothetical protein [Staphylococcus phage vB_SauH_DELF3]|nr:hypothetical protein [Staphylococcus phage vB_SauH_DELF3]